MATLKKTILISMFFIVNYMMGQIKNELAREREAFLIGMFNHYSGDIYIPDHPILKNRLTFFLAEKEKMLKIFKDSISSYAKENDFKYFFQENDFLELYNLSSFNPFEKYFKMIDNNDLYSDPKDGKEYKLYSLSLNKRAFKEKKVKLLFLAGAFLNSGTSVSEDELSYRGKTEYIDFIISLLRDVKLPITKIDLPKKENLGGIKRIFFKPSLEFRQILKNYNVLAN